MLMSLSNIFHYAEVIVASKYVNRVKYNYVSIVLAHIRQTPTNHLTIIVHKTGAESESRSIIIQWNLSKRTLR